jgi:hypothetical protein
MDAAANEMSRHVNQITRAHNKETILKYTDSHIFQVVPYVPAIQQGSFPLFPKKLFHVAARHFQFRAKMGTMGVFWGTSF